MSKKIYIGNLSYGTNEESLRSTFAPYGEILSAVIIKDRYTEQSKGFGFVEFADDSAAEKAIAELNGRELDGRRVRVNIAEERTRERRPRNFDSDRPHGGFGGDRSDRPRGNRPHGGYDRNRSFGSGDSY